MLRRILVCAVCLLSLLCQSVRAQEEMVTAVEESVPFWKRFSFHTNIVDWVLTVPNLGVEFDLQKTEKTRFSILVNGKFNWNTSHTINPRLVWNMQSGAVEVRKYWRTSELKSGNMGKQSSRDTTVSWIRGTFSKFRHNVLSGRTMKHPRFWRAYYVGGHVSLDKFTYCFGQNGKQGSGINVGISGGYSIPLYPFKNGKSIDLDLGAVVVAKLAQYDKFRYEEESACYVFTENRGRHIVPYPVLHDVHVSLVYRFNSIANKVKGEAARYELKREKWEHEQFKRGKLAQERWEQKCNARKEALRRQDSIQTTKHIADSVQRKIQEAEKLRKKQVKDSLKNAKKTLDLLLEQQADSVKGTTDEVGKKTKKRRGKDVEVVGISEVESKKTTKTKRVKPVSESKKKRKEDNGHEK